MRARVVYVVIAHHLPEQLDRLVRRLLSDPATYVLLHYDGAEAPPTGDRIGHLPRRRVEWGGMSIPLLLIDALSAAVTVDGVQWIVPVSGQDYPLRPLADIHQELLASSFDVHMDMHAVREGDPWPLWEPMTRYGYRFSLTPVELPGRVRRRLWRLIARSCADVQRRAEAATAPLPWEVLPPVVLRNVAGRLALGVRRRDNPFASGEELFAGDMWFSIRADAAREVLKALAADPFYTKYMSRCLVPDEAFFQSLIANRLPDLRVGPWRRHRVFLPGESHPHVWRHSDLDTLIATGADFARKFDVRVDAGILDLLDARAARAD